MKKDPRNRRAPATDRLTIISLAWRATWIAVRLLLIFWMAETGRSFIYQGF